MKKHLSFEEITDFAAINKLDGAALELSGRIYGHTAVCKECRAAVDATLRFFENSGKRAAAKRVAMPAERIVPRTVKAKEVTE